MAPRTKQLKSQTVDPGARFILQRLHDAGYDAVLAGGAVRDLVMGVPPKDYDIATDATPEIIRELFEHTESVGEQFGVCMVIIGDKPYEVASFRVDGPYVDGRHPSGISKADPRQDALRRDFTINALFYDIRTETVTDYTSGLADINAGIIRAVGDPAARFAEDRLRMLRADRFAARLGFTIESKTASAILDTAEAVLEVSAERIGAELKLMFQGPGAGQALTLLYQTGLLGAVLPEVAAMHGVPQPPEFHPEGDVFTHTRLMLEAFDHGSPTLGMGILLHDIGKSVTMTQADRIRFHNHDNIGADMAVEILRRYRFPGAFIERVRYLVATHMVLFNGLDMRQSTLRRHMAEEGFRELMELYRLDCLASNGELETYHYLENMLRDEREHNSQRLSLPKPFLTGEDLITMGYTPGPAFKDILDWVLDEQLEQRLTSREEAIVAVQATFPKE